MEYQNYQENNRQVILLSTPTLPILALNPTLLTATRLNNNHEIWYLG